MNSVANSKQIVNNQTFYPKAESKESIKRLMVGGPILFIFIGFSIVMVGVLASLMCFLSGKALYPIYLILIVFYFLFYKKSMLRS